MAKNISANAFMAGWQNERAVAAMENTDIDKQNRFLDPLKILGKCLRGQNRLKVAINTHKMVNSSRSWPSKLSVAWKYADERPTTINRTQIRWMAGCMNFP